MTSTAEAFIELNKRYPVIAGRVIGPGGGAFYTLTNGQTYRLNVEECRKIAKLTRGRMPKWQIGENPS